MTPLPLRRLLWIAPAVLLLAGSAVAATSHGHGHGEDHQHASTELDLSLSKPTENGLYVGTLEAGLSPLAVGPMHSWTVIVTTPEGAPVEGAEITISGGMPEHAHGLPSAPRVTEELGEGRYLVEGMKFNMPGWWTLTVEIEAAAGRDTATFNLSL